MNQTGESDVSGVNKTVTKETRFCSECYCSLQPSEKVCPHGHTAEIKTMPAVTLEEEIIPTKALATENPDPFYGSFGCQLKPAGCRTTV